MNKYIYDKLFKIGTSMLDLKLTQYFFKLIVPVFILTIISFFLISDITVFLISFLLFHILINVISSNLYHRFWSHKQLTLSKPVEYFACFMGLFSMIGSPLSYALLHRWHHRYADTDKDMHSPIHGRFTAFMGWYFKPSPSIPIMVVKDLMRPEYNYLTYATKYQLPIVYITLLTVALLSINVLGALLLAMCVSFLLEMFVNAFAHDPVSKTAVDVKILAWIKLGTYHHQHHLYPNKVGKDDPGYYLVKLLDKK
jgi:stearoyl-CoA desaturase (delta-9 desaturase)